VNPNLSPMQFAGINSMPSDQGLDGPLGSFGQGSPAGAGSGGFPQQLLGSD
jgi:hypothetical protein